MSPDAMSLLGMGKKLFVLSKYEVANDNLKVNPFPVDLWKGLAG
jgi:hypothetical protein